MHSNKERKREKYIFYSSSFSFFFFSKAARKKKINNKQLEAIHRLLTGKWEREVRETKMDIFWDTKKHQKSS